MITLCRIVLTVVTCTVNPDVPKPTPAEAIAIVKASVPTGTTTLPAWNGPRVLVIGSSVTAGPYFEFSPFPPARRLDGTLWSDTPWLLGDVSGSHPSRGGYHGVQGVDLKAHGYQRPPSSPGRRDRRHSPDVRRGRIEDPRPAPPQPDRPGPQVSAGTGGARVRRP